MKNTWNFVKGAGFVLSLAGAFFSGFVANAMIQDKKAHLTEAEKRKLQFSNAIIDAMLQEKIKLKKKG